MAENSDKTIKRIQEVAPTPLGAEIERKGKDAMEPSADPILSHQSAQVVSPPLAPLLVDKQEVVVPPQQMVDKVANNSRK